MPECDLGAVLIFAVPVVAQIGGNRSVQIDEAFIHHRQHATVVTGLVTEPMRT